MACMPAKCLKMPTVKKIDADNTLVPHNTSSSSVSSTWHMFYIQNFIRILILAYFFRSSACRRCWWTSKRTSPWTPSSRSSSSLFGPWHMLYTQNFIRILILASIFRSGACRRCCWTSKRAPQWTTSSMSSSLFYLMVSMGMSVSRFTSTSYMRVISI